MFLTSAEVYFRCFDHFFATLKCLSINFQIHYTLFSSFFLNGLLRWYHCYFQSYSIEEQKQMDKFQTRNVTGLERGKKILQDDVIVNC